MIAIYGMYLVWLSFGYMLLDLVQNLLTV